MASNLILDAALALVTYRFGVFRLKAKEKTPDTPHGHKDAVTEPAAVTAMFADHPDANVGIRTGVASKIIVLDVDPRHDGDKSLARFEATRGPLPPTVECLTGGGGRHLYFLYPDERIGNRTSVRPGLDVRGEGGYVVAPPSVHASGNAYAWAQGRAPGEVPIAPLPPSLLKLLTTRGQSVEKRAAKYIARCDAAAEGERNNCAFQISGHLQKIASSEGDFLSDETVVGLMRTWNARNVPPLEDAELLRCVENSAKHGTPPDPKRPRGGGSDECGPDEGESGGGEPDDGQPGEWKPKPKPTGPPLFSRDGRPTLIVIASELHRAADECMRRLARQSPPRVFVRNGRLAVLAHTLPAEPLSTARPRARAHELNEASLCEELNRHTQFITPKLNHQTNTFTFVPADCPPLLARWILARGEWAGIPNLTAILNAPTMLASGDLVVKAGYHAASGIYLDIEEGEFPDIPESPTLEQAKATYAKYITPLFEEFPCVTEAARAVVVSGFFSGVARSAIQTVPLHGFDAPDMGTGKSLLAIITGIAVQGYEPPSFAFSPNEEEMEKRIASVLLDGRRVAMIDNIQNPLGGDQLCSAITGSVVGVRRFHTQVMQDVPTWGVLWLATGNNLTFDKDLSSRALRCRIDAKREQPTDRVFKIPKLPEHVRQFRPQIVAAVLLCLRAYVVAGRPKQAFRSLNRFDAWSDLIRSALVWLGLDDPVKTMDGPGASDEETDNLSALLLGLRGAFGPAEFTAAAVLLQLQLKSILDVLCPARSGIGHDSRRLGRVLQRGVGRVVGGLRLELAGRPQNTNSYRVVEVVGGSGGSGGDAKPNAHTCADARACAGADTCTHTHNEVVPPRLDSQIPLLPPLPSAGAVSERAGAVSDAHDCLVSLCMDQGHGTRACVVCGLVSENEQDGEA